jgi:hypothetical protein
MRFKKDYYKQQVNFDLKIKSKIKAHCLVSSNELSRLSFDFLCFNQLIRFPLEEQIREKDESLLESIIDIEYIKNFQAPEPEDALMLESFYSEKTSKNICITDQDKF